MDSPSSPRHALGQSLYGVVEYSSPNVFPAVWRQLVLERGFAEVLDATWAVEIDSLDPGSLPNDLELLARFRRDEVQTAIVDWRGCLASLSLYGEEIHTQAAGPSQSLVEDLIGRLRQAFPSPDPEEAERKVPVRFWYWSSTQGAVSEQRTLRVTSWSEVSENYASMPTRAELAQLASDFQPGVGGQLLLWHGPPGTGKTFALRALAWEWRSWCSIEYVTDPDVFLGREPGYLLEVALRARREGRLRGVLGKSEDDWHLVVLEDTGELLSPDAKERSGQSLGRLLNLVDGLVGQGLRILVLITSNEPIQQIHPAVARPGRCAAQVLFTELNHEEATEWLGKRGLEAGLVPDRGLSIADLHAILDGRDLGLTRRHVGFAAG